MDPSNIPFGRSRETQIRRDAEGTWFNEGQPLDHEKLCRAFDRWIRRADDGRYCLENDINWAYIELEGAPLFVRKVRVADGRAQLTFSSDVEQELDPRTLREGPDGALYCDGHGGMTARFDRHAAVQLADLILEDDTGPYFDVDGERVRPPVVEDPIR